MIQLPTVTVIAVDTVDPRRAASVLEYSCKDIEFGAVKLLSHAIVHGAAPYINQLNWIEQFDTIDDWCKFIVYDLWHYVDTEHCLLIHADGFVVNPSEWRNEWLHYDYIGSPWPLPQDTFSFRDINGVIQRVGNSVSLRSRKLLKLATDLNIPWQPFHGYWNEDGFICVNNRHIYEQNGCTFAPFEEAIHFGREVPLPENININPFCFHRYEGPNNQYPRF